MLSLVLCAALSQAPAPMKVAVVQSSNLGVPAKRAAELTRLLVELLQGQNLEPIEWKSPCDNRACLVGAGRETGSGGVIAVAFASVGKDTVMDLECVQTEGGKSVAQTTFTVRPQDSRLPAEASAFGRDFTQHLLAMKSDAPKNDTVVPKEKQTEKVENTGGEPPPPVLVEAPERSRAPAFIVGGAAIVAGAVAATFVALALSEQSQVSRMFGDNMSSLTRSAAMGLVESSNRNFSISAGAAGATAALLVGAVVLFLW